MLPLGEDILQLCIIIGAGCRHSFYIHQGGSSFYLEAILTKSFSWLDVSVFVCALGDFLVFFAPVLRQIARYPPYRTSGNALKTHPKSAHDNFKQFLNKTV